MTLGTLLDLGYAHGHRCWSLGLEHTGRWGRRCLVLFFQHGAQGRKPLFVMVMKESGRGGDKSHWGTRKSEHRQGLIKEVLGVPVSRSGDLEQVKTMYSLPPWSLRPCYQAT